MFGFIKKIVLITLCVGLLLPAYGVRAFGCVSGSECTPSGSTAHRLALPGRSSTAPAHDCLLSMFNCCRLTAAPASTWAVPALASFQTHSRQHHPTLSSEAPKAIPNLPHPAEFQNHLRARPGFGPLYLQHSAILC